MSTKLNIVAASLNKTQLVMYTDNGEEVCIPQGDPRLKDILANIMPKIALGEVAKIDLQDFEEPCRYQAFSEKTGGLVKFFKVAKSKLANFFRIPEESDTPSEETVAAPTVKATQERIAELVQPPSPSEDTEMVALVEDSVLPDVQKLDVQIDHANTAEETGEGLKLFLKRVAAVSNKRNFPVKDLMDFMEKGDLPIADDGCIVAYKLLQSKEDSYVDLHTRKVTQNLGSLVYMDESLVDPARSRDCSSGLHIARRGYLSGFGGDTCFIVKVRPEDVVAVPHRDPNKMRVAAYHIVEKLTDREMGLVKKNVPMTSTDSSQIKLNNVLSGNHTGITQRVKIQGAMGADLKITSEKPAPKKEPKPVSIKKSVALEPSKKKIAPAVDVNKVAKQVSKAAANLPEDPAKCLALELVRSGKTVSEASKESGIHRRSIDRLIVKYGK